MASFNKVMIVGYTGRDPEIRYTPQGTAVCNFSIATTEKRRDRNGQSQDVTTWFRVSAWGRQAEIASQYVTKGRQVYVEGRLRQEEYTDKDGNRRQSLEVTATDVQILGLNPQNGGNTGRQEFSMPSEPEDIQGQNRDDNIPF